MLVWILGGISEEIPESIPLELSKPFGDGDVIYDPDDETEHGTRVGRQRGCDSSDVSIRH